MRMRKMGEQRFLYWYLPFYSLCTNFRCRGQNLLILVRMLVKENGNWTSLLLVRGMLFRYDPACEQKLASRDLQAVCMLALMPSKRVFPHICIIWYLIFALGQVLGFCCFVCLWLKKKSYFTSSTTILSISVQL